MTLARWLRPLAARLTRAPARRAQRPRFRPRLEGLDDRSLPSATLGYALGIGSTGQEWSSAIAADAAGDAFLAGHFQGDVNFNPADPANPVVLSSPTGTDSNGNPVRLGTGFVAKYNPDGTLAWARGGVDWNVPVDAYGIAVDAAGDVYLGGSVGNTNSYGPSGAPITYTSLGGEDGYVMKLDPAGNLIWARFMGGAGLDRVTALATDGSGNVTAVGLFQQTATFGGTTLTVQGSQDMFVTRIDASGNTTWTGGVGGSGGYVYARAVALDGAGAAYLTGNFDGKVDFDPGAGTDPLSSGGRGAQLSDSAFVMKLDAGNKLSWAGAFQASAFSGSEGDAIAVDANHNVYVAGWFSGTTDFDPGKGKYSLTTSNNALNGYLCKLTSAGQFAWAKSWGVNSTTGSTFNPVTGLAIDSTGNFYISGTFKGTVDFDPGPASYLTTGGLGDAYVLKLDAGGNFLWVATLDGPGSNRSFGLGIDGSGNVYTTGFFEQTIALDPSGMATLTSAGSQDVFLVKLH